MTLYNHVLVRATMVALGGFIAFAILTFQWWRIATSAAGFAAPNWTLVLSVLALTAIAVGSVLMGREVRRRMDTAAALRAAYAKASERAQRFEQRAVESRALAADSERREAQARAAAALANLMRDEFLSTVSHELRTPLNVILGWVRLVRSGAAVDLDHALEVIERNATAQTRLIDELLDMSQMVKGQCALKIAPFDLRDAIKSAVETIGPALAAKHMTVTVSADEPAMLEGDEERLTQAVWQVLANAVKFTPDGGSVTIELGRDRGQAVLTVRDSGSGIDAAFLPHVFEPFRQGASTRMRAGVGLGLPIARRVIELHGGTIAAESAGRDQGTVITMRLPLRA